LSSAFLFDLDCFVALAISGKCSCKLQLITAQPQVVPRGAASCKVLRHSHRQWVTLRLFCMMCREGDSISRFIKE